MKDRIGHCSVVGCKTCIIDDSTEAGAYSHLTCIECMYSRSVSLIQIRPYFPKHYTQESISISPKPIIINHSIHSHRVTRTPTKMTGAEVIGTASGLAGLFTTTITWFDYIYVARKAAPRLQSLIVKLGSAQLRLTRWGQAVGLTGSDIEDEGSLKISGLFQLDEEQEDQAIRTFRILVTLFEESKNICHNERRGKSEDDPEVKANEIKPFGQDGFKWSAMHRYLHETMQKIVHERRSKMSVPRLFKFAIYDEKHLEKLVKDINDHIDALYQIYSPSASDEEEAGKEEMDRLLRVMKELRSASEQDPVMNTAVKNILKQSVSGGRSYSPIFDLLSSC